MSAEPRPQDASAPHWLSWTVWTVAASFYLGAFYLRVAPGVMTSELMRDFSITAAQLGNFAAMYFYAYLVMQIPTGVLVDSWGARRLLIIGALVSAVGTFLFGVTSSYAVASLGRLMMGAGTAVGWVITLKVATHWFPSQRFAMMSGLGLLFGNIGALVAQVPLRVGMEAFGWRSVALASAAFMVAIGALAALVVRNDPSERGYRSFAPDALRRNDHTSLLELLKGFKHIFAYRNTWLIFCAQGGFVGAILSFTGLWGVPYLRARYDLPITTAAVVSSVMIICWAGASPVFGYLSDKIGRRKPLYVSGALVAVVGWAVLFYVPGIPLAGFIAVASVTSVACGAVILGFAFSKESVPVQYLGTISGAINVGNMIGPTIMQPVIGVILDRQWSGAMAGGLRVYSPQEFGVGFAPIVIWLTLTCVLLSLTKETYCKPSA
jgi:MFS family permease